jgi:hypothetical protein
MSKYNRINETNLVIVIKSQFVILSEVKDLNRHHRGKSDPSLRMTAPDFHLLWCVYAWEF